MKSLLFFSLLILSASSSIAQTLSVSDSLVISENKRDAYLTLQFSDTLRISPWVSDSLPFNFFIMSPKDSIQIKTTTLSTNETGSKVNLHFSLTPETSFSLMFHDALSDQEEQLSEPYVKNFDTYGSEISSDSITIATNFNIVIKSIDLQRSFYVVGLVSKKSMISNVSESSLKNYQIQPYLHNVVTINQLNEEFITLSTKESDSLSIVAFVIRYIDLFENLEYLVSEVYENASPGRKIFNNGVNSYFLIKEMKQFNFPTIQFYATLNTIEHNNFANKQSFTISSTYPNPFNPSTSLTFSVANSSSISFSVYDILGRRIQSLEHKDVRYSAGTHSFMYDFSGLPSGTYFIEAIGTELGSGQVSRQVAKVSLVK